MKNFFRYSCSLLVFVAAFSACRKEDPVPTSGTPVFTASGTIGTTNLNLKAGVNNYYMYTSYTSSSPTCRFEGDLRVQNSSTHSPSSLHILIFGYDSIYSQYDSSLYPGFFTYSAATPSYSVDFIGTDPGNQNAVYSWNFGDFSSGTGSSVTHTYPNSGFYTVTMGVIDSCGSDSIASNLNLANGSNLRADFTATWLGGDSVQFTATPSGGTGPYTYYWYNFTDTVSSVVYTQASFLKHYQVNGRFQATLKVADSAGDSAWITRNINVGNMLSCEPNFSYYIYPSVAPDIHKVIIEWTDANGNVWTSQNASQPLSSTFQVTESAEYGPNENGVATRKLHILANCTLYNGSNTMQLQNADIVFGFGHP